jgi:hypothetical protein
MLFACWPAGKDVLIKLERSSASFLMLSVRRLIGGGALAGALFEMVGGGVLAP